MPTEHNTQEEGHEHDRVRRALRDLPKVKAPWHFEADLEKRIKGKERRWMPAFLTKPVPAYAATVLVVAIAGFIAYSSLFVQDLQDIPSTTNESTVTPSTELSPAEQPVSPAARTVPVEIQDQEPVFYGPSAPGTSMVEEVSPLERTADQVDDEPQQEREFRYIPTPTLREMGIQAQPVGLRPVVGPMYVPDTTVPAASDSLDSLKAIIDSLRRQP